MKVPSIVTILILTAITIIFWIVFGVVRIFSTEPSPSIPEEVMNPLNPNYDKTMVDKVEQRIYFDKEQVFTIVEPSPVPTSSMEVVASPTPETATGSAEPNE